MAKIEIVIHPGQEAEAAYKLAFGLLVGQHKPACFADSRGHILTAMDKGFAKLLVVLSECGCPAPDRLTVFDFYTWLDYLEEKYEASKPLPADRQNAAKRQ